jgi:predicted RNA-binding Zn ribbon-like protein
METADRGLLGTDLELCLDFTDAVDWRNSDRREDRLVTYAKLLEWSKKHGILDEKQEGALSRRASRVESERVLADAVRLREAIYRIFSAVAHERKADAEDLGVLNEYLSRALSRVRVTEGEGTYGWKWSEVSPDMMLYPIASSAAGLLTSDDLGRVRECANEEEGCGSLFLDCSKSQTRRWCSMEGCGNRMKFRAYYDRHKKAT